MAFAREWRRFASAILAFGIVSVISFSASIPISSTPAYGQLSAEFQGALEPFGQWRLHSRWGEVWVPYDRPPNWRPYSYGHWVYTDDWGWYWISDDEEADWGWVTYHYGRWVHERGVGWFWVPGDEWAPAWVDWRRGEEYLGWAPLPPDELIESGYTENPNYWIFVQPRYFIEPRIRTYVLPLQQTAIIIRQTVIVNRTVRLHQPQTRIAVNPGIAPGVIAAFGRRPVPTFRVNPLVISRTHGVAGARFVEPRDFSRHNQRGSRGPSPMHATVEQTNTVVQPVVSVPKALPLGRNERGHLGERPPHAAQTGTPAPSPSSAPPGAQEPPHGRIVPKPQGGRREEKPAVPSPTEKGSVKPTTPPSAPVTHFTPPPAPHAPAPPAPVRAQPPAVAHPPAPPSVNARPAPPQTQEHRQDQRKPPHKPGEKETNEKR